MEKIMPLDILSNIRGAKPSESVNTLFNVIKDAQTGVSGTVDAIALHGVSPDELRSDVVESSQLEKEIIRGNFPLEKKGFLVVSKVIDD